MSRIEKILALLVVVFIATVTVTAVSARASIVPKSAVGTVTVHTEVGAPTNVESIISSKDPVHTAAIVSSTGTTHVFAIASSTGTAHAATIACSGTSCAGSTIN